REPQCFSVSVGPEPRRSGRKRFARRIAGDCATGPRLCPAAVEFEQCLAGEGRCPRSGDSDLRPSGFPPSGPVGNGIGPYLFADSIVRSRSLSVLSEIRKRPPAGSPTALL